VFTAASTTSIDGVAIAASSAGLPGDPFGVTSCGYDKYVSYAFPAGSDYRSIASYTNLPTFP
jgi:hypothetical protein